jgi:hypothetical protein
MSSPAQKKGFQPQIFLILLLVLAAGGIISLMVWQLFEEPRASLQNREASWMQATAVINGVEPVQLALPHQRVIAYVPPEAIQIAGVLSLSYVEDTATGAVSAGSWIPKVLVSLDLYDPTGKHKIPSTLSTPVALCFGLTTTEWEAYTREPERYDIRYKSDEASPQSWISVPTATIPARRQVCGQADRTAVFSLMVKQTEVSSESPAGAYMP